MRRTGRREIRWLERGRFCGGASKRLTSVKNADAGLAGLLQLAGFLVASSK